MKKNGDERTYLSNFKKLKFTALRFTAFENLLQKFFVIVILSDLVLTESIKYEKTKIFFVFVCYKEWQKRKLLTKIPISVNFFCFRLL